MSKEGCGPISHSTAQQMLGNGVLQDLGAKKFMNAKVGLGVFVIPAGENRFMLHQAANEGFRGVYLVCFDGPDRGNGFLILSNGDNPAVLFQAEVARLLLGGKGFNFTGIDFSRIQQSFDMSGLKQETIVNLGLYSLVLKAFIDPEEEEVKEKSKL